jgi:RNA polymerase sigma factor (sigma-70 family)
MNAYAMGSVLGHLKTFLASEGGLSDGQLLQRFVANQDQAAFGTLVRRHGPMVLGVCRRILRNQHDAEDAFQATFLVLVSKAKSLTGRVVVGNWLHGVASRTALKVRARDARRRARERTMLRCESFEDELRPEWHAILDRELHALPEKYHTLIVLCDLEGKTRREVARLLRCPEGTVSGRLHRARAMLARRLALRGLTVSVGAVAAALAQGNASGVPLSLVRSTIKAAASVAAGKTVVAGVVSPQVAALREGVLKAMLLTKLRTATTLVLALALLGLGAAAGVYTTQAEEPGATNSRPAPTCAAAPAPETDADPERLPACPLPQPAWVYLGAEYMEICKYRDTWKFPRHLAQVYDMQGRKVFDKRRIDQVLNKPILALVVYADPPIRVDLRPLSLYLTMFKEDTLLFVVPSPSRTSVKPALRTDSGAHSPYADPAPPPGFISGLTPAGSLTPDLNNLAAVPGPSKVRLNSKCFKVAYMVPNPSEVTDVELWHTRDGQKWELFAIHKAGSESNFLVKVEEEGLHGFTITPVGRDAKRRAPEPGALPQLWVHVDEGHTVSLRDPVLYQVDGKRKLLIRWEVTLKDLPRHPIMLSWASSEKGPWSRLGREEEIENTGYLWRDLPPHMPDRLWIRLQVRSKERTFPPITVLNGSLQPNLPRLPEGRIVDVEPVKN